MRPYWYNETRGLHTYDQPLEIALGTIPDPLVRRAIRSELSKLEGLQVEDFHYRDHHEWRGMDGGAHQSTIGWMLCYSYTDDDPEWGRVRFSGAILGDPVRWLATRH